MRLLNPLLLSLMLAGSAKTTVVVSGRVTDVDAKGIKGVAVNVHDKNNKPLADEVSTDTSGGYRVEVPPTMAAVVDFSKLGYEPPHKLVKVDINGEKVVNGQLINPNAKTSYYRTLGEQLAKEDEPARQEHLQLIAYIPVENQVAVVGALPGHTSIAGTAKLAVDRTALPGVTVTLFDCSPCPETCGCAREHQRTTITDASGNYAFSNLPKGKYQVLAELEGLTPRQTIVNPLDTISTSVTRDVELHLGQLTEAVTVTGTTQLVEVVGASPREPLVFVHQNCGDACEHGTRVVSSDKRGIATMYLQSGKYRLITPNRPADATVFDIRPDTKTTIKLDSSY